MMHARLHCLQMITPAPRGWRVVALALALGLLLLAPAGAQGLDDEDPQTTLTQPAADAWRQVTLQVVAALETTDTAVIEALFEPFVLVHRDLETAIALANDRILLAYNAPQPPAGLDEALLAAADGEVALRVLGPAYLQFLDERQAEQQTTLLEAMQQALGEVADVTAKFDPILTAMAAAPLPAGVLIQVNAPEQVQPGATTPVRMRVYNPGDAPAEGVELLLVSGQDQDSETQTIAAGTLAPGEELIHIFNVDLPTDGSRFTIVSVGARATNCIEDFELVTIEVLGSTP